MFVRIGALKVELCHRDRREARRYALNWEVRVTIHASDNENVELSGTVRNLSSTGVFVYLRSSVQIGRSVLVSVRLPFEKETWMNLPGTVVRAVNHTEKAGIAIKFSKTRPVFVSRPSDDLIV